MQRDGATLCFEDRDGNAITQGDVYLGATADADKPAPEGISIEPYFQAKHPGLWANRTIPYVIESGFEQGGYDQINAAIQDWTQHAGFSFVPHGGEADYITFHPQTAAGCFSAIGRVGGKQQISVVPAGNCAVAHEIGHAIGLLHEQSRPDRDQYIAIHYENMDAQWKPQFDVQDGDITLPYDVRSIMHYPHDAFSNNGKSTITNRDGSITGLDYKWALAAYDIAGANSIYHSSPATIPPAPTSCGAIYADQGLGPDVQATSCDGRFRLIQQGDGNLVLYQNGGGPLWGSATNGRGGYITVMQGDGNLVIYHRSGSPVWASGTAGHPGAWLAVQNDGNLVIYDGGRALWASNTCCH